MELFRLVGLHHPGRVNVLKYGTIELANVSDQVAVDLWRNGCPYLEPTEEGRKIFFPNEVKIDVEEIFEAKPPATKVPKPKNKAKKTIK
ncbi:MAG TPA: hypothetical protein PKN21_08935 [Bacteroidales bacterium]|nr:hypothetical protein [Bacteroidales bacterium]